MNRWIMLPYDRGLVSRACLRRAVQLVRRDDSYSGVLLATAGIDPDELDAVLEEARSVAGPGIPLEAHLLRPDDPVGAFGEFADSHPEAHLATPYPAQGCAPWYTESCRAAERDHTRILFRLSPQECAPAAKLVTPLVPERRVANVLHRAALRFRRLPA